MFLKHLFLQYADGKGLTFGSKWMSLHGRLFLGVPKNKGLGHVRQDLQDNYYRIKEDRFLPKSPEALKQWELDSMLLAQYRDIEHPQVARACLPVGIAICTVLVALTLPSTLLKDKPQDAATPAATTDWLTSANSDEQQWQKCLALQADLDARRATAASIPNFAQTRANCQRLKKQLNK